MSVIYIRFLKVYISFTKYILYCYSYGFYKCITGCWVNYGGTNQSQFEICFMKLISKSRKSQLGEFGYCI